MDLPVDLLKMYYRRKVITNFVQVDGDSRINVKIKGQEETELNGQGPSVTNEQFEQLMKQIESMQKGDYVVLAGSVPASIPTTFMNQSQRSELKRYSCSSRCKW